MKIRIIYNSCNVDSCLAVNMFIKASKERSEHVYIETVPFTKSNPQLPSQEDSLMTLIVGAQMDPHLILQEKEKSKSVVFFNYIHNDYTEEQLKTLFSAGVDIYTPNYVCGEWYTEVETMLDNSLCKLMCVYMAKTKGHDIYKDAENNFDEIALIQTVMNYINFDKALNEQELIYLYANYDNIVYCAANKKVFNIIPALADNSYKLLSANDDEEPTKQKLQDCPRVQTARVLIGRNLSNNLYGTRQKNMVLPTACVAEEHAIDVIRLVSYPYQTVVTYEDTMFCRIWRVYSKDQANVREVIELIEHNHMWTENKVTYLMSAIPAVK